jgi:ABC-type oligopeptide transport system substrate-binding subunit
MPFFKIAIVLILFFSAPLQSLAKGSTVFRTSLSEKPKSLNPHLIKSASISFLYPQLYRNLLKINSKGEVESDLASQCEKVNLKKYKCSLKSDLRWSNGEPLTTSDALNSYINFLNEKTKAPLADFLFNIKNAQKFYKEEKTNLGLSIDKNNIIFDLENDDPDFFYKIASPITAIVHSSKDSVYSGPYVLNKTNPEKWWLETNPYYHTKNSNQVRISIQFIKEISIAISLFNQNKLDYIHRLPTLYTESFQKTPHFYKQALVRLDYLAFPKVVNLDNSLFEQLLIDISKSLNYNELKKLLFAPERPGCFGYTDISLKMNKDLCYDFSTNITQKQKDIYSKIADLKLIISTSGGDDSKRVSEWIQDQLKKNLNLNLKIQTLDNQIFLNEYKKKVYFHRRSLTSLAPTCLSLLESFQKNHAPYLKNLNTEKLNSSLLKLRMTVDQQLKSKICSEQLKSILNEYSLIPLGPVEFNYLVRQGWSGFESNPMYHFDFSQLSYKN